VNRVIHFVVMVILMVACFALMSPLANAQKGENQSVTVTLVPMDPSLVPQTVEQARQLFGSERILPLYWGNDIVGWQVSGSTVLPAGACVDYDPRITTLDGKYMPLSSASLMTIGFIRVNSAYGYSIYPITHEGEIQTGTTCVVSLFLTN
jgi:hypothetical protein